MMIKTYNTRVQVPTNHTPIVGTHPTGAHEVTAPNLHGRTETEQSDRSRSKLLSCRKMIHVSMMNVRTVQDQNHRAELVHNFTQQKIEVLGIQEHCIIHDDPVKHENIQGKTLVTSSAWRNDAGAATGGVGVLLNSHATKCVTDVRNHTERILVINFSGNPAATVISTYSPTNAAPEDEVQQYYDNLCRAVESVPAHNVLIITGDFNARLGKEHVNFPFHEETNRNGEYLADFIQEKGLISANTKFQKNKSRQWTYMSPQGLKYQLDYILVRKKWQNSITDA